MSWKKSALEGLLTAIICSFFAIGGAIASWFYWLHLDGEYPGSRMRRAQVFSLNDPTNPSRPIQHCSSVIQVEPSQDNLYYIPGKIEGSNFTFLIDTGANTTSIPINFARQLGWIKERQSGAGGAYSFRGDLDVKMELIETASGQNRSFKVLERKVKVAGKEFLAPVIVFPAIAESAIVGMDVLSYFDISFDKGMAMVKTPCQN